MPKYIKKKDLKNAIDECTWYHIGKGGELVEGANSSEHEPLYKYSDIKEIIKNLPTRKFETEPKRTALSKALKWTYGDEPSGSENPNNCETCKHYHPDHEAIACERCLDGKYSRYEPKTEPQSGYCNECKWYGDKQVCGRCRSRNLYEPKTEPLDKDTNVRSKESQTERRER